MRSKRIISAVILLLTAVILGSIAPTSGAHQITKKQCVAYAIGHPGGPDIDQYHACWKWAQSHNDSHGLVIPVVLSAIRACESGQRSHGKAILGTFSYTAQNRISTASGAYQYLDSTWAGTGGYAKARYAPRRIQDQRALRDFRHGTGPWQFGDWQRCWGVYRHR